MPWDLYEAARPLLFAMDPERAHERVMGFLEGLNESAAMRVGLTAHYAVRDPALEQTLWGLTFPAPVGLAAGFDKSARAPLAWQALGFGFAELGTVTPKPQEGNPKPRLWRDAPNEALVNRMGFNNDGAPAVAQRLARAKPAATIPLGVNIGKQKETYLEAAGKDYLACLDAAGPYADFVVVNVSSPNTPGLRALQEAGPLRALLEPLVGRARVLGRPMLLKIDPDMPAEQLEQVAGVALDARVDGIVATNTSAALPRPPGTEGGLSGRPLRDRATDVLRRVAGLTEGKLPLVGVGGVATPEDAYAKVRAGASLVEVYTGFVYGGPGTARRLHEGLLALLARDGHAHVRDAVGADLRERRP